jgi:hypothetical protein
MELFILKSLSSDLSFLFTSQPDELTQFRIITQLFRYSCQYIVSFGHANVSFPGTDDIDLAEKMAINTIKHLNMYKFIIRIRNPSNTIAMQIINAIVALSEPEFTVKYDSQTRDLKNTYSVLKSLA